MVLNPRASKQLRLWVIESSEMTSEQACVAPAAAHASTHQGDPNERWDHLSPLATPRIHHRAASAEHRERMHVDLGRRAVKPIVCYFETRDAWNPHHKRDLE